jgi:bifunctional DNA-binding transcriptional regulator/antitoxin component of YhaV-PrlF toxin-antitoxin module
VPGIVNPVVFGDDRNGLRVQLPVAWVRGAGIHKGDRLELVYGDDVAVIVVRPSAESERVKRAMREAK